MRGLGDRVSINGRASATWSTTSGEGGAAGSASAMPSSALNAASVGPGLVDVGLLGNLGGLEFSLLLAVQVLVP